MIFLHSSCSYIRVVSIVSIWLVLQDNTTQLDVKWARQVSVTLFSRKEVQIYPYLFIFIEFFFLNVKCVFF